MALTTSEIIELYTATFNRAADADGVAYWETQTDLDQTQMANAFIISDEAAALYPASQTDTEYVEAIYANLFGHAADAAGLTYWTDELAAGVPRENMIVSIVNGALGTDQIILDNKTEASTYQVDAGLNTTDTSLASVDETDASVVVAKTATDVLVQEAIDAVAIQLTTSTDSFVGTADSDIWNANASTLATADTILDSSTTDADILYAEVNSNAIAARIQNVETINVNGTYVTAGLDLASTSGTTNLNLTTNILGGTATVTNASSLNALNINAGTNITTVAVTATASGTRDTVNVNSGAATATTITGAGGLDTFNVTTTGNLTINTTTAIDTVTANLSDAATTIAGSGVGNVVINQSGVAGVVTATTALSGNTASTSKTTITGDQNVTISSTVALVTDTMIVDSSTGTSTLKITDTASSLDAADIQVDVVSLAAATLTGTMTINANSKLSLDAAVAAAETIQVASTTAGTALTAGQGTLLLDVNKTQTAAIITDTAVGTVILNAGVDATAAAGAVITMADLSLGINTNTLVVQGAEDLTLSLLTLENTTADVVSATTMTGKLTVAQTVGTGNATLSLGSNDDSITSTAAALLTIHGNGGNDTVSIASAKAASVVNGGNGNDTITGNALGATLNGDAGNDTITGGNAVDTINGGTGNDTINGGNAADLITLGAGTDTVQIVATQDGDVISDFVIGEDKIVLTGTGVGATITVADATNTSGVYTEFGSAHDFTLTGVTATDLTDAIQFGKQATATAAAVTFTAVANGTMTAGSADDHITAAAGTLTLDAGAGDDVIVSATNNAATLTGGAGADTFDITNTAASTITDFGGSDVLIMGAAANSLVVTVAEDFTATAVTSNASTATANTTLTLNDGVSVDMTLATMASSAVGYTIGVLASTTTGSTIVGSRAADAIVGTKYADTITGGENIDTIAAGKGVDTIILTESVAAADVVTVAALDTGITLATADTITGFATGSDTIAAYLTGAAEGVIANGSALADFTAFVAAADVVFTAAGANNNDAMYISYNAASSGDAWVAIDENVSGTFDTGDTLLVLTGINLVGEIALADFV